MFALFQRIRFLSLIIYHNISQVSITMTTMLVAHLLNKTDHVLIIVFHHLINLDGPSSKSIQFIPEISYCLVFCCCIFKLFPVALGTAFNFVSHRIGSFLRFSNTVKPVFSGHSKRRSNIGFQDRLSLYVGQKYCRMLQG